MLFRVPARSRGQSELAEAQCAAHAMGALAHLLLLVCPLLHFFPGHRPSAAVIVENKGGNMASTMIGRAEKVAARDLHAITSLPQFRGWSPAVAGDVRRVEPVRARTRKLATPRVGLRGVAVQPGLGRTDRRGAG